MPDNILRVSPYEFSSCDASRPIVGVGGLRKGQEFVLKFVYDTGDTQILCLDDSSIGHLVAVLKTLAPSFAAIAQLGVLVGLDTGEQSTWSPS